MSVIFISFALAALIAVSFCYSKTRHPLFTTAKNAGSGLCSLLLVNLVSGRTGCYIPLNPRTLFVSTALSVPGVVALLFMKLIFNY